MDLTTPAVVNTSVQPPSVDLLASGLDSLLTTSNLPAASSSNTGLLGDIFGFNPTPVSYSPPKQLWLPSENGKGLEIMGTFSRKYVSKNKNIIILYYISLIYYLILPLFYF